MHAQSVCQHFFCFNSTVIIRQPVKVLISSLRTEFIYDDRHGFFGHYKVNLTWTNPTGTHTMYIVSQATKLTNVIDLDLASIAYFQLHMVSHQNHCESAVFTPIYPSRNVRNNYYNYDILSA